MKSIVHALLFPCFLLSAMAQEVAVTKATDEPQDFAQAMDLYQSRKYAEAKAKFIEAREGFKSIATLPDNRSSLAEFYEMECLRKLGDLDGLAEALRKFDKAPLTGDCRKRQLEIDVLWENVRVKAWDRVTAAAEGFAAARLPGEQRAQIAYCQGLAFEGLGRPAEALFAYNTAITADAGASEEITRQAALRILTLHRADPEVQNAIKHWGTADEDKNSIGRRNLKEAAAVAGLFQLSLGGGNPLPVEFSDLLFYRSGS